MKQVGNAGGDYRTRPYGAAQVQMIFDAGVPETERLDALRQAVEAAPFSVRSANPCQPLALASTTTDTPRASRT